MIVSLEFVRRECGLAGLEWSRRGKSRPRLRESNPENVESGKKAWDFLDMIRSELACQTCPLSHGKISSEARVQV